MAFKVSGGSFYPPLSSAYRLSGGSTVSAAVRATLLRFTRAQPGSISLDSPAYVGNEGAVLSFSLTRTSGASGAIAVDYAFSGLTEGAPNPATGTVTWNNGEGGTKTVQVVLGIVTATRNGSLTLSNARSLSGGAQPSITGINPASVQVVNIIGAPAADVTTVSIVGSGVRPVTFGMAFKRGDVPSGMIPVLTDSSDNPLTGYQTQARAFHADGSVFHAVLHAQVSGGNNYKIRTGAAPSGSNLTVAGLLAAIPGALATVTATGATSGTADLRDLLSSPTNRAVMTDNATANLRIVEQGPRVLVVRVAQNIGTHLRCNFEIRWYGSTLFWVDAWMENGYANLAGQGALSYTGALSVAGATVATEPFTITTTHRNHTCWRPGDNEGFWSDGSAGLYVQHNTQYIQDTGAVPNYRRTQTPSAGFMNALPSTCATGDNCQMRDVLDGTGAGIELAIIPQWDANYIKSGGDQRCFRNVMANTKGSTAYSMWLRSSLTGEFMNESDFPAASWNQQVGFGAGCFTGLSQFPGTDYSSHLPSVAFLAYLLTGNQFHLDAMHAWVTHANLWNSTSSNFTYQSKTYRKHYEPSIRGQGWQYRSNGQAAAITPANHYLKAYFNKWVEGVATTFDIPFYGPGGSRRVAIGGAYCAEGNNDYRLFFHMFWHQSLAYLALDLGLTVVLPVAQYASVLIAGLFGNTGEFPFEASPRQSLNLGSSNNTATPNTDVFHGSFSAVRTANSIAAGESGTIAMANIVKAIEPTDHTGLRNECLRQSLNDSYFANILPCLSYLHRLGIDGGFECWVRATLCTRQPDFSNAGQFDIGPREVELPAYIKNAAVLTWTQIPGTLMAAATSPNYPGDPSARVYAWGGMAIKWVGSEIRFVAAGGHNDSAANDVVRLRLNAESPAWAIERAPTLPASPAGASHYSDGRPASRHVYHDQQFHQGRNQQILHGCTFTGPPANAFDTVDAYSPSLNDYLPAGTYASSTGSAGAGPKAMNPASGCIYYVTFASNMRFARWSPNTGTTVIATPGGFGEQYKSASIDPVNGVFLHSRDAANNGWRSYNIDTGASTARTPETAPGLTSTHQSQLAQASGGQDWDIRGRRHLFYPSGQDVLAINPTTFQASPLGIAGTPPPASTPNGLFSRFRYVPELDIVVAYPNYGTNVYFFKFAATQRPF